MKQVVTSKGGALEVVEVPAPSVQPGFVLVRTAYSLVSAGTEGAQVREGKASLLTKVREHPKEVRQVLEKLKKEGLKSVTGQVQAKLAEWRPLGYSLTGTVLEVGEGVTEFAAGDRVACAGAGHANHAEIVCVPRNLVAKLPESVSERDGAFVTLGAIALHGVRRANPTLGESALVVGLGLVGQLAAQFLTASGVKVVVSDLDPERVALAKRLGAVAGFSGDDPDAQTLALSGGHGLDMALICAGTKSSAPVHAASRLLRDKGRMVVVGDVGMELERGPFFKKELDFTLSRSYGPGRYDPQYEEGGVDYPVGYVRWTEGRNLGAVLDLIGTGKLNVNDLISHEVPLAEAVQVYERILAGDGGLGTLIRYDAESKPPTRTLALSPPPAKAGAGVLVVGAGYFAKTFHLPNLAASGSLRVAGVVSGTGANAKQTAERFGGSVAGTDLNEALQAPGVDAVLIATRHHLHVPQALAAIQAGKHVLLEKPLSLDADGLSVLAHALRENPVRFAVGFNRRHAPLAVELKQKFDGRQGPLHGVYRMNGGRIPKEHWVNDPVEGGGRILGEGCHVFDWFNWLTDADPVSVSAAMARSQDASVIDLDNLTATVTYADGSVMTLLYTTQGPKGYAKEQFEVFGPGLAATLTDYKDLRWHGSASGEKTLRTEDKGQAEEMKAWAAYLTGQPAEVVEFRDAALSTWLTLMALESARTGQPKPVASTLNEVLGG